MKPNWDIEALIKHCTLPPQVLVAEVAGRKRLETARAVRVYPLQKTVKRLRKGYA
jgi:hypothetical protein